ncbi:MAG: hypothetical protein RI637_06845 [Acidimicrobiia bacterium]|jgi:ABC-type sugar transport system permease subunit|nr:hypothetical protein [Acidimicrobiia bacterium]
MTSAPEPDRRRWSEWLEWILTLYANVTFLVLWVGLAVALIVDQEWLDRLWLWLQDLPRVLEILVWVVFLPITVTLWIWQSSWSTLGRVAGFTGMIAWTLLALSSLRRLTRSK